MARVPGKHLSSPIGVACVSAALLRCAVYDSSLAGKGSGGAGTASAGSASGGTGGTTLSGEMAGTAGNSATSAGGAVGASGSADVVGSGGSGASGSPELAGGAGGVGGSAVGTGAGGADAGLEASGESGTAGTLGSAGATSGRDASMDAVAPPPVVYVNSCSHVHWTATASSSGAPDVASNSIDGYALTRWTTGQNQSGTDFLQVDFGASVMVSQVVLDNSGGSQDDYPRAYTILLSADGVTFPTTAASGTVATPPGATMTIPITPQAARAIKIVDTGTAGLWWSVYELHVGCQLLVPPPKGAIDPYDPVSWTASASSSGPGEPPSNAFDSDLVTRWTSGQFQTGGESFVLDLGAAVGVSQVSLNGGGGGDFPVMYVLEVSADGQAYVQVAAGAGAPVTQMQFARKTARFLRITQTGADATHWWSIYEIAVKP